MALNEYLALSTVEAETSYHDATLKSDFYSFVGRILPVMDSWEIVVFACDRTR